jgi:hypothetical protein
MTGVGIIEPLLWCLKATDVGILALDYVFDKLAHHGKSFKTILLRHVLIKSRYVVKS